MASAKGQRLGAMYGAGLLTDANNRNAGILQTNRDDTNNMLDAQTTSGLDTFYKTNELGRNAATDAYGRAYGDLSAGYDRGRADFQGAIDRLTPFVKAGADASRVYRGSLGLGGADERAAAEAAFTTSPGFQKRQDLATDGVARQMSALGTLGGGNTVQAVTDRAYDLGTAEYGGWQDRIATLGQQGQAAAGQQSSLQSQMGGLSAQGGQALAGLTTDYGRRIGDLYTLSGQSTLGARQTLGGQIAGVNNATAGGLVTGNTNTAKGISDLAFEAGKAGDAARSSNEMMPLYALGTIANLAKTASGVKTAFF